MGRSGFGHRRGAGAGLHRHRLGDSRATIRAGGGALTAVLARKTRLREAGAQAQLFWRVAVSAPILLAASLFFGPFLRDIQPIHWFWLIFQAAVVVTGGFAVWLWLLLAYPTATLASFSSSHRCSRSCRVRSFMTTR